MSQLTIYKASAGSGKTFTLARHFLALIFQQEDNYKHILAATFTNKATEEMKSRIISELHTLATGAQSAHREYLLTHLPHIKNEEELKTLAKKTLSRILHDYSHLSITTIDRFFQKIIRSFAREIRVSSNYNIELDDKTVLKKASEQLLFDLEKKGNEALINWMTNFAEEQIENGNSWNFSKSIDKLSEEFLKESYKRTTRKNEKALGDFVVLKNFLDKITKHQYILKNEMQEIAQKGVTIANNFNLTSLDFKYGKSSGINFLYNITAGNIPDKIGTRTLNMQDNQEAWYTKSSTKKDDIIAACNAGLFDTLNTLIECWEDNIQLYISIDLIRANFYSLGILSDLEHQLKIYTDENNILLLSNSNELIANVIDNSDTPFIYEKTGNHFKHFMIDEFQDTSQLQWGNFKPLIANSLSEGNDNLIVGDVKQSIYRWRNSDWKLLNHSIIEEFRTMAKEEVLPVNWRSNADIIRFNNTIIQNTAQLLQTRFMNETGTQENDDMAQLFASSYSDIIQEIPENAKDGGYVSFQFYNKNNDIIWQEDVLTKLPGIIEKAQDNGYSLNDMAILVRRNNEGAQISRYLLNYAATHPESKYRYDVISDEALWISSSYDVQFLINIFKHLTQPGEIIASQLNILYQNYINKPQRQSKCVWNSSVLHRDIARELQQITSLSLLETTEELITRFKLGSKPSEAIFIQSFIDIINDFEYQQSGSFNEFLTWWDENGKTKSISTPKGQDAINIQTVHKAKGLEYKIVLVPFLDWEITKDKGYLWTSTETEPLNEIPYLPVRISKKLNNSLFKNEYQKEKLLQYIDSLNLLYVAFTRAKEALIGFGDSGNNSLSNILIDVLKKENTIDKNTINTALGWNEDSLCFEYGELPVSTENKISTAASLQLKQYKSNKQNHHLQLRLESHDFEISENKIYATATKTGKIWHSIFEQIKTLDELPQAVEALLREGIIAADNAKQLISNVENTVKHPIIETWFSPQATIHNETTILTPEGHNYRPDRVIQINNKIMVVDFKFGNIEKNSYKKQVQRYMQLIHKMGKNNIYGYLWYVRLNKVVEINL